MKKKSYFDKHYKKSKAILEANGENLDKLLASYKLRLEWARKKEKVKKTVNFRIKINTEVYARFKMAALCEDVYSKALLEAFMNYFVEGDEDLQMFMDKLSKYNDRAIFASSKSKRDKILLINKLNKIYAIPVEWWRKYSDLNNEELDF